MISGKGVIFPACLWEGLPLWKVLHDKSDAPANQGQQTFFVEFICSGKLGHVGKSLQSEYCFQFFSSSK